MKVVFLFQCSAEWKRTNFKMCSSPAPVVASIHWEKINIEWISRPHHRSWG